MKKASDIFRIDSPEFIEDSLDDFIYELGYKINIFDNINGLEKFGKLYFPKDLNSVIHIWSFVKEAEYQYLGHIINLSKVIKPFQPVGLNEYEKIQKCVNQLQNTLPNWNVYYTINTRLNGLSNMPINGRFDTVEDNLIITLVVVSKYKD
jgi:hypothetical protein